MHRRTFLGGMMALGLTGGVAEAQGLPFALPPTPERKTPIGFPQDVGPHDESTIEWWYYNSFLSTESGKQYAVVASFFRVGLTPTKKGHYLIYALVDLQAKKRTAYSYLDKANRDLLKSLMTLVSATRPDDPRPLQLLAQLQKDELPKPHRALPGVAEVTTKPHFGIAFGENHLEQVTDDGRTWEAKLIGDDFSLEMILSQHDKPPMLVGGTGKTGLNRPDDMYYVSLTQMQTSGTLVVDGKAESFAGSGWLDRQWGSSWVVGDNGWDWFGVQLDDRSQMILYRVKDNKTGKILRSEATLQKADGSLVVDTDVTFAPMGKWTDPVSKVTYPAAFAARLGKLGMTLTLTPAFPDQTIPVIGIGDAIWEGVIHVGGTDADGKPISGRGYMELVGYKAPLPAKPTPKK